MRSLSPCLPKTKRPIKEGLCTPDIREYINDTMRFLPVEVQSDSAGSGTNPQDEVFPTSARFDAAEFNVPPYFPDPSGASASRRWRRLLVPRRTWKIGNASSLATSLKFLTMTQEE